MRAPRRQLRRAQSPARRLARGERGIEPAHQLSGGAVADTPQRGNGRLRAGAEESPAQRGRAFARHHLAGFRIAGCQSRQAHAAELQFVHFAGEQIIERLSRRTRQCQARAVWIVGVGNRMGGEVQNRHFRQVRGSQVNLAIVGARVQFRLAGKLGRHAPDLVPRPRQRREFSAEQ